MNTTVSNTKIGEIGSKVLENSGLVNKTDYNPKISNSEGKYFTSSNYDEFTKEKEAWCKDKRKMITWWLKYC